MHLTSVASVARFSLIAAACWAVPFSPASASSLPADFRTSFESLFLARQASSSVQLSLEPSAPGQALVYFASGISDTRARKTIKDRVSVKSIEARFVPGLYRVEIADQSQAAKAALISTLGSAPGVLFASANHLGKAGYTPVDVLFPGQWYLEQSSSPFYDIDASAGWDITRGNPGTVIAILDSGLNFSQPELIGRLSINAADPINFFDDDGNGLVDDYTGWNFVDPNNNTQPVENNPLYHGTVVSLVAAASAGTSYGSAGVDHFAKILPLKVLDAQNFGPTDVLVDALTYAALRPEVDVINLSLIEYPLSPLLGSALQFSLSRNKLLVVCGGNLEGFHADDFYPAAFGPAITVAWTNSSGGRAAGSSQGNSVDVAAPGEFILASRPVAPFGDDQSVIHSGCSFATPLVAGSASLLRALFPGISQAQLQQVLQASVQDLGPTGWDSSFGWGSLKLDDALVTGYSLLMIFQDGFNDGSTSRWSAVVP